MFFKDNDKKTALKAKHSAQLLAFAPMVFQVVRCMREFNVLEFLFKNEQSGLNTKEISQMLDLSEYAVKIMLETSLSVDVVKVDDKGKYRITKTGYFVLKDAMTKVNFDYSHYLNYEALFYLDEALKEGKPKGLHHCFEKRDTIYPIISKLPQKARDSWFAFDHFYSDTAFDEAIDILLKLKPKKILDIGGNSGKFCTFLANKDKDVKITIADLPQQIELSKKNIAQKDFLDRVDFYSIDILDENSVLPKNYDVVWMSQFLDCFDENNVIRILKKVKQTANKNTKIFIVEPLWDKQKFETAAFCIINTSPYFTAMANGYSKMFNYTDLKSCIHKAGLSIIEEYHELGICQSILVSK